MEKTGLLPTVQPRFGLGRHYNFTTLALPREQQGQTLLLGAGNRGAKEHHG